MMNSDRNGKDFNGELMHSLFVTYRWLWGDFIRTRHMLNSLVLTSVIGLAGLIALLSAVLFMIRIRKNKEVKYKKN